MVDMTSRNLVTLVDVKQETATRNAKIRNGLRNVIRGSTFYQAARLYGIKIEELYSYHRRSQEKIYSRFGFSSSPYSLTDLQTQKSPPAALVRFLRRRHGGELASDILSKFYLVPKEKTSDLLRDTSSLTPISAAAFAECIGCRAISRSSGSLREIGIGFGKKSSMSVVQDAAIWCETYSDYLNALEGGYRLDIIEVVGYMSKSENRGIVTR